MATRLRTLIVEDSLTMRKFIRAGLETDPEIEVVGEAENGEVAVDLCRRLQPHVITMDMMMPKMNGLETTEQIMAYFPTPILIVSSSFNRGEVFRTYDALAAGAVDVLEKPLGTETDGVWAQKLISTLKIVSRIKVITHPRAKLHRTKWSTPESRIENEYSKPRCVAIGVSTGGPSALSTILGELPADFPVPILLVMHIGNAFDLSFAEWLDGQSSVRVRVAVDGELLPPVGTPIIIMAPPSRHLVLRQGRLRLTDAPERHSCRPSVDVLFESIAAEVGDQTIAILLTGMGRDGAAGLLAIKAAGGTTIAQDEASSVIFGMPREAILLGAAGSVLSLEEMAPMLVALAGAPTEKRRDL